MYARCPVCGCGMKRPEHAADGAYRCDGCANWFDEASLERFWGMPAGDRRVMHDEMVRALEKLYDDGYLDAEIGGGDAPGEH